MPVAADHQNFYDVTHGGAVFSVADCAFSLASNAHGDTLTAEAEEITRGRSLATYRVTIRRSDDRVCGLFTGTVFVRPGQPEGG
jgi:acyl-CoA thioesterase